MLCWQSPIFANYSTTANLYGQAATLCASTKAAPTNRNTNKLKGIALNTLLFTNLQNSIIFSLLGVIIFWLCFVVLDKITPYDLWREVVEKNNLSLAIIVAAMCLGIALIIAAAIHG